MYLSFATSNRLIVQSSYFGGKRRACLYHHHSDGAVPVPVLLREAIYYHSVLYPAPRVPEGFQCCGHLKWVNNILNVGA